jgi:hypothetical protein
VGITGITAPTAPSPRAANPIATNNMFVSRISP